MSSLNSVLASKSTTEIHSDGVGMIHCAFVTALAVSAVARVAAQVMPPPRSSGPTRVLTVTLPNPDFNRVINLYGWVDAVESDRTTIGLECLTSSTWAYLDPCSGMPRAKVLVAPPTSSTLDMMVTHYADLYVSFPDLLALVAYPDPETLY